MTTTSTRLRKRPVEITGIQWTGENADELIEFTGHRFEVIDPADRDDDPDRTAQVFDELHNTWVGMYTRQWVLRGVKGEFYPCDGDVLAETYDVVDPNAAHRVTVEVILQPATVARGFGGGATWGSECVPNYETKHPASCDALRYGQLCQFDGLRIQLGTSAWPAEAGEYEATIVVPEGATWQRLDWALIPAGVSA